MTTVDVELVEKARLFHSLHQPGRPLVLPNAWDVASARVVEAAGALAVATTSAGVAWSLGFADGGAMTREAGLAAVARIAAAVSVPVTADIERGYAEDPAGVAETIRGVIAAGAVGVHLEDALGPVEANAARIAAARAAADALGFPLTSTPASTPTASRRRIGPAATRRRSPAPPPMPRPVPAGSSCCTT
jgi:2-methylisocitrate lyase-like PEP mutase family enzyme